MDSDNILNEFQKHLDYKPLDIELPNDQNDLLDAGDMISEEVEDKFLNGFEPEMIKLEPNISDDISYDDSLLDLKVISPILGRPRKPIPVVRRPPSKRVVKKPTPNGDVDKYVNRLLEEDITASLKSLEKKYKKEQLSEGGLCEQCGLSFTSATEYKKHVRSHDDKG